jgi:hypothetical protein
MVGRKLKSILDQLKHLIFGTPTLDRDNALLRAKVECDRLGWKWEEPVRIQSTPFTWKITTNSHNRGINILLFVHKRTGEILSAKRIPR